MENKVVKSQEEYNRLIQCKNLLQSIIDNKVRGNLVRSRTLAYEYGDRPSKYFFNLEKSNQSKKSIYKLKKANNTTIDNKNDILNEIYTYYSKLYSGSNSYKNAPEDIKNVFIPAESHVRLTEDVKIYVKDSLQRKNCLRPLKIQKITSRLD